VSDAFAQVVAWENLLDAYRKAALGKRGRESTARFEHQLADRLLALQEELQQCRYQPGAYCHFHIHDPKQRLISAAPFRDRVVHHALCNVIEPRFERRFIFDSYANRPGKGTHRAVDRVQYFARRYRYVLRMDIVKHFPSIDHAILRHTLAQVIPEDDLLWLVDKILESGDGVLKDEYTDPLDHFIKRDLRCAAYVRYVDDVVLFSDSKRELWHWKQAVVERLATLRLIVHPEAAVLPVTHGSPWLGFIVYPGHRRVKARNVRHFSRRLQHRWRAYCGHEISFAEFDASVQGGINHVRYADTWGLRTQVLGRPLRRP
jgi:hypothetical protein